MNTKKANVMENQEDQELTQIEPSYFPLKEQTILDPGKMQLFVHDKMISILELLHTAEYTIMDLSDKLEMNPGSIKRYLDKLVKASLVCPSKIELNKYHIKLKYYRIAAKMFKFEWQWP